MKGYLDNMFQDEEDGVNSYKTMTAMGILNTIQNLLSAVSQVAKEMCYFKS